MVQGGASPSMHTVGPDRQNFMCFKGSDAASEFHEYNSTADRRTKAHVLGKHYGRKPVC